MLGLRFLLVACLWVDAAVATDAWLKDFTALFWTSTLVSQNQKLLYIDGGEIWNGTNNSVRFGSTYESTVAIDLTTSWTNASLPVKFTTTKPKDFPFARYPLVWYQNNKIYSFGGSLYYDKGSGDNTGWIYQKNGGEFNQVNVDVAEQPLWELATNDEGEAYGSWVPSSNPMQPYGVTPAPFASMATVVNNVFYSVGGYDSYNGLDLVSLPGVLQFDGKSWQNNTAQPLQYANWGQAIPAPSFGPKGSIIYIGGFSSSVETAEYLLPGNRWMRDMAHISIYDIESGMFYMQKASGESPESRYDFCAAGVEDSQGHLDIFVYAGASTDGYALSDMFVLSIPSFRWTPITGRTAMAPIREEHSCQVIGNRQMVSVGGTDGQGGFGQVPKNSDPWTNGIGVFDMTALAWVSRYNPNAASYVRATHLTNSLKGHEYPAHWDSPELAKIFGKSSSSTSTAPHSPASSGSQSSSSGLSGGAIAGIVIAIVIILALIGVGVWFFLRRRRRQRETQELPKHQSVSEQDTKTQPAVAAVQPNQRQYDPRYDYYRDSKALPQQRHELPGDSAVGELEDSGRPELPSSPTRHAWEVDSSVNSTLVPSGTGGANNSRSTSTRTPNSAGPP